MERKFIVTINGERFTVDPTGTLAITTSGRAIGLEDKPKESRFK